MDYLVKAAGENRHRLGQYRKMVLGLRLTVGILAAALLAGGAASLLFGGVLYLAALSAQGVYLSQVFRLRK